MNNQSKHSKLHVDSMIRLRALANYLDEKGIPSLIKDLTESARLGGFGANPNVNELYVYEEDLNTSKIILSEFLKGG